MRIVYLIALLAANGLAADPARGEKEEAQNCIGCHSLRIVHSQRLSKAAWNREIDKMAGWGTNVGDREALLEYLVANFGDDKPAAAVVLTQDGSAARQK